MTLKFAEIFSEFLLFCFDKTNAFKYVVNQFIFIKTSSTL